MATADIFKRRMRKLRHRIKNAEQNVQSKIHAHKSNEHTINIAGRRNMLVVHNLEQNYSVTTASSFRSAPIEQKSPTSIDDESTSRK